MKKSCVGNMILKGSQTLESLKARHTKFFCKPLGAKAASLGKHTVARAPLLEKQGEKKLSTLQLIEKPRGQKGSPTQNSDIGST